MKKFCSKAVVKHQKLNNKLQKSIKKPRKEGGRTSDNRPYTKVGGEVGENNTKYKFYGNDMEKYCNFRRQLNSNVGNIFLMNHYFLLIYFPTIRNKYSMIAHKNIYQNHILNITSKNYITYFVHVLDEIANFCHITKVVQIELPDINILQPR